MGKINLELQYGPLNKIQRLSEQTKHSYSYLEEDSEHLQFV